MATKQTQTSSSQPFTGEMYDRNMSFGDFLQGRMGYNPQYTGNLATPINATQTQATGMLSSQANNPMLQRYASGEFLDPTTDANVVRQANAIKSAAGEAWGQQSDRINSNVNRGGFWGGSGHQKSLQDSAMGIDRSTSGSLASLYGNAANAATGNMLSAQGSLQSGANALLNAGNNEYNIADTATQRDYGEFIRRLGYDQQNIGNMQSWLSNSRNPTTTGTSSDGGAGAGSAAGSIGGALIACFPAGTMIETVGAPKSIEDIRVGDVVLGLDDDNNIKSEKVINVAVPVKQKTLIIKAGGKEIEATLSQEFLTTEGIILADALSGDETLITIDGPVSIDSITKTEQVKTVYDFTTEGRNIIFANGFAVEGGY